MKKKPGSFVSIVLAFAVTIGMAGCGGQASDSDGNNAINTTTDNNVESNTDNNAVNTDIIYEPVKISEDFEADEEELALYESLFNPESKIKVTIDISEEELAKIEKDYEKYSSKGSKSPIYRKCNMAIEINGEKYTIEEVGIRMKGNTSREDFYSIENGMPYALVHFKFSFTQTFDEEEYYGEDVKVWESDAQRTERKNRTFATLEGIDMKWNRNIDSTYTREIYAYRMYRDMGVLAPNCVPAQYIVNGDSWGVYKIYEPIDKIFIKRYFDKEDSGGDLYKCTWGSGPANYSSTHGIGIKDEDNNKFYTYDLKTNKKTSDNKLLKNLINTISKSGVTKEDIEAVVDIDNWIKFAAVSYFLGMPDDLRNNYNNHYVYFRESDNKAVFIAYDCEICMGINAWNPTGDYMTSTDPFSSYAYGANSNQENKLVVKTVTSSGFFVNEYKQVLNDIAAGKWMKYSNFEEHFRKAYVNYASKAEVSFELKKMNSDSLQMSADDTIEDDNNVYGNGNMSVKDYMNKMIENYKKYQ